MSLTTKQIADRRYYREHKAKIAAQKKQYRIENRAEINARQRQYNLKNRNPRKRCFICGGVVKEDLVKNIYQCQNPECEAEFKEIL